MSKSLVNLFFQKTFNTFDESIVFYLQISHLSQKIQSYIREIVGTTEALLGKNSIYAVMLFGSAANSHNTKISDVDLMVIVKDTINKRRIKEMDPILTGIVIKHRYRNYSNVWHAKMLHTIEKSTGMFCSYFITRISSWNKNDFAEIFSTNPLLTRLLAPNKIVLDSMRRGTIVLYQEINEEINLKPIKESYPKTQLIKSLILNLMTSLGTLFILFLNKKNIKYMLEAVKWSIRSCDFYSTKVINPLSEISETYQKLGLEMEFLQKFLELRNNPRHNLIFCLKVPFNIIKIHLLTLKL
ncbi:nucleotidyltransferase domain-containing protein [Promethearchaeum syntrophicum]|uniref:Nucleotidyltransferase domain-containing protein n=1 Tax=Promethearchaeum syntrophicum TaxID=2594042 RepID=A0A5B9DCM4_9ARCH|nr:nucleotidyltransferase domain-containing protein [Candidatus Prometheoarchaeum syntrophicum]QEE16510.1 Nucleotidyltransferase domain protein [Candidatus Prometheoarchaeum syntrophicum]